MEGVLEQKDLKFLDSLAKNQEFEDIIRYKIFL